MTTKRLKLSPRYFYVEEAIAHSPPPFPSPRIDASVLHCKNLRLDIRPVHCVQSEVWRNAASVVITNNFSHLTLMSLSFTGRYLPAGWSADFQVPCSRIQLGIPGWDTFDPGLSVYHRRRRGQEGICPLLTKKCEKKLFFGQMTCTIWAVDVCIKIGKFRVVVRVLGLCYFTYYNSYEKTNDWEIIDIFEEGRTFTNQNISVKC